MPRFVVWKTSGRIWSAGVSFRWTWAPERTGCGIDWQSIHWLCFWVDWLSVDWLDFCDRHTLECHFAAVIGGSGIREERNQNI